MTTTTMVINGMTMTMTLGSASSTSTSMSGMDMSNMDMSSMNGGKNMAMSMASGFHAGVGDPILSTKFTPNTSGAYAGGIIFLCLLAVMWRLLFAAKTLMERRFLDSDRKRRAIVVRGRMSDADKIRKDKEGENAYFVSENGEHEEVRVVKRVKRNVIPWRFSRDLPRALMSTIIAAVGYLLMLAVMTYNGGYLGGILLGILLGDLIVGRFLAMEEH